MHPLSTNVGPTLSKCGLSEKIDYKHTNKNKGYILIGGLVEYNHGIIETSESVCVIRIRGLFTGPLGFIFTYGNPTEGFTHGHTCAVRSVDERFADFAVF